MAPPSLFREMKGTTASYFFSCSSPSSLATCSTIHPTSVLQPASSSSREIDRRRLGLNPRRRSYAAARPALVDPADPSRRLLLSSSRFGAAADDDGGGDEDAAASFFFDIIPGDLERPAVRRLLEMEAQRAKSNNIESAASRHSYSAGTRDQVQKFLPRSQQHARRHMEAAVLGRPSSSSSSSSSSSYSAKPQEQCERSRHLERAILRPSSSTRAQDQVVALRVSLHCKGCEAKVRRHIAKMQGVRSFEVDLATKKVTVAGDVTPLGVLNSISKVKHAQFWQSPPRASASF